MDERTRWPEDLLNDGEHGLCIAEDFANDGDPLAGKMAREAAVMFQQGAGELLHDELELLGLTDEQIGTLTEIDLLDMVPDIMAEIREQTQRLTAFGKSALLSQVKD
ncbi:MAG TPA: hypothetical protein VMR45_05625 [Patescibacteria group bacterium]|nr:hypothetical protein [Patescibacteria group bacterium]